MTAEAFAPLAADAAPLVPTCPAPEWRAIMPVPEGAPPPRLSGIAGLGPLGRLSASWWYCDANSLKLFLVLRFDTAAGKEIRPICYAEADDGRRAWRSMAPPEPRPLYGLDRLAAQSDAAVLVVEGEKSADAAGKLFSDMVAITSPGGSGAAAKADWTPLAGRRVVIWPDRDDPGRKFAETVARLAFAAGAASVCVVEVPADWPLKWDLADDPPEGVTTADLRQMLDAARPVEPATDADAPAWVSWGNFTMSVKGLEQERERGKGEAKEVFDAWISAPFELIGRARDPRGLGWGRFLRWRDPDGRQHEQFVADAALHGEPSALCGMLAEAGLTIARNEQRCFATYLSGANTKTRVTRVARTGWHDIDGADVFVLPNEAIGRRGAGAVVLDAAAHGPYETRGTLADWQAGVAALAADHALPVLAISAALAGPLLHLAGIEGGGLNFFGPSSKGKTTLLQLAASVWGRGGSPGYVRSWRATANGLEGVAASATDTALVLDELGQVEARDAAAAFYSLSNGTGKARASRDGGLREPKSWRCIILSSGEVPTESKLSEDRGRRPRAGQLVRMLDIPADRQLGFGAFDSAGPDGDAAMLSKTFKHAAIGAFGTAGPEFVRRMLAERISGDDARALVAEFAVRHVPARSDGQVDRAAQRLGLVATAGEIAAGLGIVPWREGAAREAAGWALAQWIELRGGSEPAEVRQAIQQVRLFIEQHGESRFEPLDVDDARPTINRAGWRKGTGPDREWWIPPETWKVEVCAGLDPKHVARTLVDRGMIERAGDGLQPVRKVAGQNVRVYILNSTILDGGQ